MGMLPSHGQSDTEGTHPVLQKRPPREVLNSDLLALPEREREAWLHGAVSQMVTVLSKDKPESARCVEDWYFKVGDGADNLPVAMKRYSDLPASATILALARQFCPEA